MSNGRMWDREGADAGSVNVDLTIFLPRPWAVGVEDPQDCFFANKVRRQARKLRNVGPSTQDAVT